ncbi:MAG: extracellular solute-binding protein [Armatimonadetes bacterium]|nr:extracellular solute-binding protein [Armatimonadota bacterium]
MRRAITVLAVAAIVLSSLTAIRAAPGRPYEGRTFSVFVGISPLAREDTAAYIAPRLKEKWGVDLSFELMGSTAMVEKIIVQRANPRVSVANWDEPVGIDACAKGLCANIDLNKIPNIKDVNPIAIHKIDGNVRVLTASIGGVGLIYNRYEFGRRGLKPPTSWYDLWRDDVRGRVSVTALESTWGLSMLAMFAKLEGGRETNVEPAFAKLKTLLPRIHTIHTWSSELAKLMQLGEVWLSTTGANMGPALQAQGFPAEWIAPKEGAAAIGGGTSIIANAPLQDVAHDYLNLVLSPEFQALRARNGGLGPVNRAAFAKLTEKEKQALPIKPLTKLVPLDWASIMRDRQGWIERWHREIRK